MPRAPSIVRCMNAEKVEGKLAGFFRIGSFAFQRSVPVDNKLMSLFVDATIPWLEIG